MRDATSVRRSWICTAILPPPPFSWKFNVIARPPGPVHPRYRVHEYIAGSPEENRFSGARCELGMVASFWWDSVLESICVCDIIAARFRIESVEKILEGILNGLNMINAYRRSGYKRSIVWLKEESVFFWLDWQIDFRRLDIVCFITARLLICFRARLFRESVVDLR